MDAFWKSAAVAAVAPKLLKNVKWKWVAYGAMAYFAVKFLVQRGILSTGAHSKKDDYIDVEATSLSEKVDLDYRPSDVAQMH